MTHNDLPSSAVELRNALRGGELSAREVAEASLRTIHNRTDLGAFIEVAEDQALTAADAADRLIHTHLTDRSAESTLPNLIGMPLAHKDLVDVAGSTTTHGSAATPDYIATTDDPSVATLRAAGTLSLGKTQVPEFGLTGYSENLIAAPARNPLDPERTAGGSSGGSAAAVAAGMLPFAPASDGGGSIRIPALACGLVGLKPGLGAVPSDVLRGTADSFGTPKLAVSGPIAHSAADAALLFDAMRGDPHESSLAAVQRASEVSRLHIGVSDASPFASAYDIVLDAPAREALDTAISTLESRHHRVEAAGIHYDPRYAEVFATAWTSGLSLLELEPGAADLLTPLTRTFRDRAVARSQEAKHDAGAQMQMFAARMREQWGRYDAVLTPGLAILPPRVGAFMALDADDDFRLQCEWAPYTSMVNVSGQPAVAVPVLRLPSGLSMGVQLIGRKGGEAQLLQLAAQLMTL